MKSILLMLSMLIAAPVFAAENTPVCAALEKAVAAKKTPALKLARYLEVQWEDTMKQSPEFATYVGFPGQNDRWTDASAEAIALRKKDSICQLAILKKIPADSLRGEERVNYNLAKRNLEFGIEGYKFDGEFLVLNHLGGMHIDIPDMLEAMPTATKKDYEDRIARLEKVPQLEAQTEALLREGLKRKVTPVKMFLGRIPSQFDKVLTDKIEDSPLYATFKDFHATLTAEEKSALQARAREVIQSKAYPALKKLREFVEKEYIPGARETIAFSEMPKGKEWYAYMVKNHTTTDMTPDQLHELGIREVARITGEMEKIKDEVKFKGDLKAFNKHLLTDKKYFYDDKDKLLVGFRDIAKRIDPELPKVFKTLPRLTYGIKEMAAYKAAQAPAAYYQGGSLDSGRPGYFEANTSDLPGRPKWGMEALTLHEAVPGHHLQISVAQEIKGLPDFRKQGSYTAFVEGWGLYAESLGPELGMFKDPYSRYGQYTYEIWRAIRLVVDTGMHSKGWTRQQALDYFAEHMAKSPTEIAVEVDRYITWPGQALAYKVGQLKFRELREKAHTRLGDKFDVREFHDQLLGHGSLPLDVLEKSVNEWVDLKLKQKADKKIIKDKV